jgi:hypothetical protein
MNTLMRRNLKKEQQRCKPNASSCSPGKVKGPASLARLVADYKKRCSERVVDDNQFFRQLPSIGLAIHHVAFAIDENGRCFNHQFRIKRAARSIAKQRLTEATKKLRACRSFDALHSFLESLLSDIYGLGEMYIYDAAQRLGVYLGLSPDRVYLHAGVRKGARALGLDTKRRRILEISELPRALHGLSGDDIENFLCIYEARFKQKMARVVRRGSLG